MAKREYHIISSDSHTLEPPDLWETWLEKNAIGLPAIFISPARTSLVSRSIPRPVCLRLTGSSVTGAAAVCAAIPAAGSGTIFRRWPIVASEP